MNEEPSPNRPRGLARRGRLFDATPLDISDISPDDEIDHVMLEMSTDSPLDMATGDVNGEVESVINVSVTLSSSMFTPIRGMQRTPGESMQSFEERLSMSESSSSSSNEAQTPMVNKQGGFETPARRSMGTPLFSSNKQSAFSPIVVQREQEEEDDDEDLPTSFVGYISPNRAPFVAGPTRPVNVFEIYEDEVTPTKYVPAHQVVVKRMFGSTSTHAAHFALRVFNVSHRGRKRVFKTRTIVSRDPQVVHESMVPPGWCKFSYVGGGSKEYNKDKENGPLAERVLPPLVGVVVLDLDLFTPSTKGLFSRTDLLQLDPMFLMPLRHHVTILMPSQVESFMGLNHFVVELFVNGELDQKIMSLAIHKHVFFYLLFQNVATIPISNIEITPNGDLVNMVLHVRRIRKAGPKVFVAIEQIDFTVQDGFEKIRFVDTDENTLRRRTLFDASTVGGDDDEEDESMASFRGFMESLKEPIGSEVEVEVVYALPSTHKRTK